MIIDERVTLTTDESGDADVTSAQSYMGRLLAIEADVDGLDATADTVIKFTGSPGGVTRTVQTLTNVNTNFFSDVVADALDNTGAASGTDIHPIVVGKPNIVIAQGGNTKTATFILYIDDLR